jgi:hypothetical protein
MPQKLHAVVFNFMANLFNPEPSTRPARKVTCIQPFAPFSILSLVFPSPNDPGILSRLLNFFNLALFPSKIHIYAPGHQKPIFEPELGVVAYDAEVTHLGAIGHGAEVGGQDWRGW